jgi:hypothetical protein
MEIKKCNLTLEEKHNMIAEAAFLRFKQRNYLGDPVEDWLAAEAELENALSAYCRSAEPGLERSAYRRIPPEVRMR